jgi:hypothetical protein
MSLSAQQLAANCQAIARSYGTGVQERLVGEGRWSMTVETADHGSWVGEGTTRRAARVDLLSKFH